MAHGPCKCPWTISIDMDHGPYAIYILVPIPNPIPADPHRMNLSRVANIIQRIGIQHDRSAHLPGSIVPIFGSSRIYRTSPAISLRDPDSLICIS